MGKTLLLIIDPQNDFCDLPAAFCPPSAAPALPIVGAHADMQRLATFIIQADCLLDEIVITLDSHQVFDIAHPAFWQQASGAPVAAFSEIFASDVRAGRFEPRESQGSECVLSYLETLEAKARYTHRIWPAHCVVGTWGHNVHADVQRATQQWEARAVVDVRKVTRLLKGLNPWTEHFSAIEAEVPDANDAATHVNQALLTQLRAAERIFIAGEAASHCVKATTEHIAAHIGAEKLCLLTDAMSSVDGFANEARAFMERLWQQGATITSLEEQLAYLRRA